MDAAQWPQDVIGVVKTVEKKPRPQKEEALNCPRCSSTNTKFCYYNNYSLSQPRYFCKTCRRYWTEGGSLRNVPVGGGTRKNKRSSSSSSSSPSAIILSAKKKVITNYQDDLSHPNLSLTQNPKIHEGQDLNLDYNPSHYEFGASGFDALPFFELENKNIMNPKNPSFLNADSHHLPVMEFFKPGNINIVGWNPVYNPSDFPVVRDFKPSLGFSADGLYGNFQGVEDHANSSSRNMLFPFGELKQVSNSDHQQFEQDRGEGETNGFWNGMLAGGSSW